MIASESSNNGLAPTDAGHELPFESYGVRVAVTATNQALFEHLRPILPPGWSPCPAEAVQKSFGIAADPNGTYGFVKDGEIGNQGLELELALMLLDTELRLYIARKAPRAIFIHAGAVGYRDKAVVIPGMSFAGKTTLVAELVRRGATYYSDEFAVLGEDGLVHPYAKPLSLRDGGHAQTDHSVDSLGGVAGEGPLPMGAIVVTSYRPGAEWEPRHPSVGEGAMALLANAVPARERPDEVMRAISRSTEGAVVLQGDRGEADVMAPRLLAELDRLTV